MRECGVAWTVAGQEPGVDPGDTEPKQVELEVTAINPDFGRDSSPPLHPPPHPSPLLLTKPDRENPCHSSVDAGTQDSKHTLQETPEHQHFMSSPKTSDPVAHHCRRTDLPLETGPGCGGWDSVVFHLSRLETPV